MTTNIKAIVFDYGNVLVEWDPWYIYRNYFNDPEAMQRFFHEVNFVEWNEQQDKGRPFAEGVAVLSQEFPKHAHLIQAYHDHWKDSIVDAHWGTVEIMKRLKQKGYPLYGLSNWSAEMFPHMREQYDFFNMFDDMVISGEVGHIKPHPEIFHILLEKIGRPAQECLFIDDSLPNIQQAQNIGFAAIHFESSEQLAADLHQLNIL